MISTFMSGLAAPSDTALSPVLRTIENHWASMRNDHNVPLRHAVDPVQIDHALPYTFTLQHVATGVARLRIAGQKLHDLLNMDPRGMPISAFFAPADRAVLATHIELAFAEPAIIALPLRSSGGILRKPVTGQILFLPLADELGGVTRILGGLVTNGALGAWNRRLHIDAAKPIRFDPINMAAPVPHMQKRPDTVKRPTLQLVVNNG